MSLVAHQFEHFEYLLLFSSTWHSWKNQNKYSKFDTSKTRALLESCYCHRSKITKILLNTKLQISRISKPIYLFWWKNIKQISKRQHSFRCDWKLWKLWNSDLGIRETIWWSTHICDNYVPQWWVELVIY